MRRRFAPYIIGTGLLALAAVSVVFVIYALILGEPALGFGVTAVVAALIGLPLARFGNARAELSRHEGLFGVLLLWLAMPLVGRHPLRRFWRLLASERDVRIDERVYRYWGHGADRLHPARR